MFIFEIKEKELKKENNVLRKFEVKNEFGEIFGYMAPANKISSMLEEKDPIWIIESLCIPNIQNKFGLLMISEFSDFLNNDNGISIITKPDIRKEHFFNWYEKIFSVDNSDFYDFHSLRIKSVLVDDKKMKENFVFSIDPRLLEVSENYLNHTLGSKYVLKNFSLSQKERIDLWLENISVFSERHFIQIEFVIYM